MLKNIVIKNLALIDGAELALSEGLNVLSGETGAGKSIIVDAIMLLLGGKYDKSLLRYGEASGFVEGVFDVAGEAKNILAEMGYEDDEAVVSRRFFADGKNEVRVNGRIVTLSMLRRLTEKLVDIYGQHEYISVAKIAEQNRLFDYYVRHNIENLLAELKNKVESYNFIVGKLNSIGSVSDRERLMDILKFQLDEIEKAGVKKGEEEELTARRKVIASAEKINNSLGGALNALAENEVCALGFTEEALDLLGSISHIGAEYEELYARLKTLNEDLNDIAETIRDELDKDFDAGDLEHIEDRLDLIKNLRKKYGDFDEMTKFYNESSERLYELMSSDKLFAKYSAEKEKTLDEIYELSRRLSDTRRELAPKFEKEIKKHLNELSMAAEFEVRFAPFPTREDCEKYISPLGMDRSEFYFSANRGQPLQPMTKVISGGEMSRFMLALKVVNGEKDEMPTMIFDEIDVGISGNTGRAVAQKLQQIALSHQVLCVTHLPQIAAMASKQYYIKKVVENDATFTRVTELDHDGMIKEIARLSGGYGVTNNAEKAAEELKDWCDEYKSKLSSENQR